MKIGKNYKIESESLNVTIYKRFINKKKEEDWRATAYFANVEQALKYLVDLKVNETGLKDLKTVVEEQKKLYGLIHKACQAH